MTFPIADLSRWLRGNALERCEEARITALSLITYGCVLVRPDEKCYLESDNEAFLDMLEDYFALPDSELLRDARPELGFQVGVTLEGTEKPRCAADLDCQKLIHSLEESQRPLDLRVEHTGPMFLHTAIPLSVTRDSDPKARFFWRMGERPETTAYEALNAANVVPERFHTIWAQRMDLWGQQMKQAVSGVAQMLAEGLGLPTTTFTEHARYGAHLLAPTATDLVRNSNVGDIFAGFHSDLGFLTIHGRSRYPGLSVWARNTGKRIEVKMPLDDRLLLVQAGKQLEHVTAGLILAGFHEVACTQATKAAIERAQQERPGRPLIRISSTFFYHLDSDYVLDANTLGPMRPPACTDTLNLPALSTYPAMTVGEQMERELRHIKLMAST